ncbi:MAG: class I SAM-dependent methyltransferase [Bacteroidota bacterium]
MEKQLMEIRDQQRESWNKFSPGWKKWDELVLDFLGPMGREIIAAIQPKGSDVVLDIAAGTGEPGLTIAAMIPDGKVVITDLAEDMIAVARENAAKRAVTNVEFSACDVTELPFADNSFDAISCRMGFMFFPDMQMAANEMARVLKPGGRIATSVWDGPEKNFWVTTTMGAVNRNMELPPPAPGAPGMFRCAQPGLIRSIFEKAGLKNVTEKPVAARLNAGTTDRYWNMTTEVAAPFVAAMSKADEATRQKIKKEVYGIVAQRYPEGKVFIDAAAIVIAGEK